MKTLNKALAATPLEKVQMNMDQFEKIFETLDVQTNAVTGAMQNQINLTTPQQQVNRHAIELVRIIGPRVSVVASHALSKRGIPDTTGIV